MRIQSWFGMMNLEKRFLKLSRNLKTGNYEEVIILNDRQILVSLSFYPLLCIYQLSKLRIRNLHYKVKIENNV